MSSPKSDINSFGKVQMVKCIPTFMWTVNNFCVCHKKTGDPLKSPLFTMGQNDELTWCIHLYPRGFDKDYSDYVSLFLQLKTCDREDIKAKYKFSIMNNKKVKTNEMSSDTDRKFTPGCDWGFREFITRDSLFDEGNGLLPDNKLTIYCEIDVNNKRNSSNNVNNDNIMIPIRVPDNQAKLISDLESLVRNKKFCDVSFVVGDKKFYAHKTILAARSPVLSLYFESSSSDKKVHIIEIQDFDQKVIKELLRYMYTGKVDDLKKVASNLLPAAKQYELEGLKKMCEDAISKTLNIDNAAEVLILADKHQSEKLKQEVIDFIISNGESVMSTEGFKVILSEQPHLIAEAFRTVVAKISTSEIPNKRRKSSSDDKPNKEK